MLAVLSHLNRSRIGTQTTMSVACIRIRCLCSRSRKARQDTAGAGQNMEARLAETTSMFFGQCYGWPLAPLGTCEVTRFRTNSRIRFLAAPSPMPAKPLKTTSEAPRSEEG
jgi:hypothetical protein